eukprot:33172-Eustigmatos_ZCMA.PRE.1
MSNGKCMSWRSTHRLLHRLRRRTPRSDRRSPWPHAAIDRTHRPHVTHQTMPQASTASRFFSVP